MPTFLRRRYMRKELKGTREVYIGIIILLLTGAICGALMVHSRLTAAPLFEIPEKYLQQADTRKTAAAALPTLNLANWSKARDVRTFSPQTLYEKIDGRADLYLQFNFQQLTFAKYINEKNSDQDIQVFLFDMGAPENALGIYMAEYSGHPDPAEVGRAGYRSGPSVFFRKGPMYVMVLAVDESLADICLSLSERIAQTIEDEGLPSWAEVLLPQSNRIEGSLTYLASDAFGLDFLHDIYTAQYSQERGRIELFVHQAVDALAARKLFGQYNAFITEDGQILSEQDGITIGDSGGVIEAVFCLGRYLAGVRQVDDVQLATEQARAFQEHIMRVQDRLP